MKKSGAIIFHAADSTIERQELGPYGLESLIPGDQELHMTAYRVTVQPHAITAIGYHQHAEEIYWVLEGCGTAILDGKAQPLKPGDFLRLPPGTTHGFVTQEHPLVMLDIHSPGSRPDRDIFFTEETPEGFTKLEP